MDKEQWTQIARVGTFIDSAGRPQSFSEADLAAIAAAYKPDQRDAPLVFGHPATNAPAFGWVQKLKAEGGKLFAQFAQVPGIVRDLVAQGHYRHVSMSLMPDRLTLRHVGLLGAAQPAIDGLAAVDLASGDAICVDFTEPETVTKEPSMATMEELQQQVGALTEQVNALKVENTKLKAEKDGANAEKGEAEKKAETTAAEFAAYRGDVETQRREARVSALVQAGKVKPAERESVMSFASKLAETSGTLDFAMPDGKDGKTENMSLEEHYLRDLEARSVDERFADFAAPPAHGGHGSHAALVNPDDITAKL